jgi:2-dehydropantoate 2-reductase
MSWDIKSVAVLGSGAIGLYYGGRLAESGHCVSFLARSGFEELTSNGLLAKSIAGDFHLPHPKVFQNPTEIGPVDLVIISWKATVNHLLASTLPPLLHSKTQVLTLQNGLGNCEQIAEIVGSENVCGGLCFVCINRTSPASIHHTAGGKLTIGEFTTGLPDRAQTIANHFSNSKIPASAVTQLAAAQWEKLVWNIPFNGLAVAEGGVTTQDLLANPDIESEIRMLMREILNAAHAQGIHLDESLIEKNIERTRPMDAYRPSTMIDFVEGREIELDPIWQEPLRRAKLVDSPMPALEKLISRIQKRIAERAVP